MGRETVEKWDFNKRGERLPENRTDCFRSVAAYALALPRLVAFSGSLICIAERLPENVYFTRIFDL